MRVSVALDKESVHKTDMGYYVDLPNFEEFVFEKQLSNKLDADNFLPEMWNDFDAMFDWGDCDFFGPDKCKGLIVWLTERLKKDLDSEVREFYLKLTEYCSIAVDKETGIYFDF